MILTVLACGFFAGFGGSLLGLALFEWAQAKLAQRRYKRETLRQYRERWRAEAPPACIYDAGLAKLMGGEIDSEGRLHLKQPRVSEPIKHPRQFDGMGSVDE